MPDIKTPALERCIGRMGEYGPGCLDGLCARKGECQYPEDCPSPRAVADAAIKELTALRQRAETAEAEVARLTRRNCGARKCSEAAVGEILTGNAFREVWSPRCAHHLAQREGSCKIRYFDAARTAAGGKDAE